MEEIDLGEEYRRVHVAFDWPLDDLARLALEGIESTWLADDERRRVAAKFLQELAAMGASNGPDPTQDV